MLCAPTILILPVMSFSEQLERIMEAIKASKTKWDEKLAKFRADIKESQEKAATSGKKST